MYIEMKLKEIKELVAVLDSSNGLSTEQQFDLLKALENLVGENPLLIKYQSIILYNSGYITEAKEYLTECLKKNICSYELNALLFELLKYTEYKLEAFYALSQMYRLSGSDEQRNEVLALLEDTVNNTAISKEKFTECFELFKRESFTSDYRSYPMDEYGSSSIRLDAFPGRDPVYSYLVNIYKSPHKTDVAENDRIFSVYETVRGKFIDNETSFSVNEGDIMAISSTGKESLPTDLTIHNLEASPYSFRMETNLIRYFKVKHKKEVLLNSNREFFVSHFKRNTLEDKPKLVMQFFLDGLSFQFVNNHGFEQLMPNTYGFFKNGYINNNCHANGEWTLPSLMSMCTGKYTTNHYVFHTSAPHKGEQLNKLIQEYFEEAGYMTGRICSNWRGTPSYGYFKGTNRSVYSPMIDRMFCDEITFETLEHLEAFKDFYNYVWVTMEDLHAVADGVSRGVLQETTVSQYITENISEDSEISVFRNYNPTKIEEYKAAIKKVDFYLGIIFDYIKKNYRPEEYIITLNSDHGQKFIEEDDYMFTRLRTNVPFMMAGRNVICKNSNELMSNVDIFPTLLKVCGLPCEAAIDGKLLKDFGGEERTYTITESIFPGQTYKLAMNDKEHLITFETKEDTKEDGLIPIKDYSIKLINRASGQDEAEKYPEKVETYEKVSFDHIKNWIDLEWF